MSSSSRPVWPTAALAAPVVPELSAVDAAADVTVVTVDDATLVVADDVTDDASDVVVDDVVGAAAEHGLEAVADLDDGEVVPQHQLVVVVRLVLAQHDEARVLGPHGHLGVVALVGPQDVEGGAVPAAARLLALLPISPDIRCRTKSIHRPHCLVLLPP